MLGVVVLVVAIIALRDPKARTTAGPTNGAVQSTSSSVKTAPRSSSPGSATTSRSSAASTASSGSTSTSASPSGNVKSVPLIVLNNTTIPHLAQDAAQRFESGGWTVSSYSNYQNDILSTCAYYDPSTSGAQAAAQALQQQYPTIKRVEPRFPQLPSGPVVVVLTPDYSPN